MKNLKDKYLHFCNNIITIMRKPEMSVLPGHLSFFLLLSAIPIIIIFGMIANTFSLSYDNITDFITHSLPAGTSKVILPLFNTKAPNISYLLLIFSAIYIASRGTKAIILTSNNIYDVNRKAFQDVIKSIVLTILIIILMIFTTVILVLGGKILRLLNTINGIGFFSKGIIDSIDIFRWPISFLIVYFSIKLIYLLAPNKKINRKSVRKGSLFTTISWIV